MRVRAFQPRRIDPPHFVAETLDELEAMEGGFVGAEQCDGCGNSSYRIEVRMITPGTRQFVAVCKVDETDADEFKHTAPCGAEYPISIWDEEEVVF